MLLLSILTASCLTAQAAPATAQPAAVLATYDLAQALLPADDLSVWESLLPGLSAAGTGTLAKREEVPPPVGGDAIVAAWRRLRVGEFEYEGRDLHIGDDGRLYVVAPPPLQEATARYLAFLENTIGASTEISIDVWSSTGTAASVRAETPSALVPSADFDRLAEAGAQKRTYRLQVRPGTTARLDLSHTTSLVTDYNVEIAQGSAIYDPITEDIALGTRLFARAAPSQGGLWLALILAQGEALGDVVTRELVFENLASTQDRPNYERAPASYQSLEALNRSLALNTFVPDGQALVLQSSFGTGTRRWTQTVAVRQTGRPLQVFQRYPGSSPGGASSGGELVALDAASVEPPACRLLGDMVNLISLPSAWRHARFERPFLYAGFVQARHGKLADLLIASVPGLAVEPVGPWFLLIRDGTDPAVQPRFDDALVVVGKVTPAAHLVQVSLTLRESQEGGAALARWVLPVRTGARSAAVLGRESIEIDDYDVEVAQFAAVADTQAFDIFEGLAVWVEPNWTNAGDLAFEIDAHARWREGEAREFDPQSRLLGAMRQSSWRQLVTRERIVFAKQGAPWRTVLGEVGGAGGLALEVEVRSLR